MRRQNWRKKKTGIKDIEIEIKMRKKFGRKHK
jgi:hypothetical protein